MEALFQFGVGPREAAGGPDGGRLTVDDGGTGDRRPETEDRRPKTEDRRPKTEDRRPALDFPGSPPGRFLFPSPVLRLRSGAPNAYFRIVRDDPTDACAVAPASEPGQFDRLLFLVLALLVGIRDPAGLVGLEE